MLVVVALNHGHGAVTLDLRSRPWCRSLAP